MLEKNKIKNKIIELNIKKILIFILFAMVFCVSSVVLQLRCFASSLCSSWIFLLFFCVASGLQNITGEATSLNCCFQIGHSHCSPELMAFVYNYVGSNQNQSILGRRFRVLLFCSFFNLQDIFNIAAAVKCPVPADLLSESNSHNTLTILLFKKWEAIDFLKST